MSEIVPTSIRLKEKLLERIRKDAEKEKRSVSKQIEYMIEYYYNIKDSMNPNTDNEKAI